MPRQDRPAVTIPDAWFRGIGPTSVAVEATIGSYEAVPLEASILQTTTDGSVFAVLKPAKHEVAYGCTRTLSFIKVRLPIETMPAPFHDEEFARHTCLPQPPVQPHPIAQHEISGAGRDDCRREGGGSLIDRLRSFSTMDALSYKNAS